MKIFISWSKDKSRRLALATKKLLENTLSNAIEVFFSPDMYKGTCVDNEIHRNLIESEKCIVCITAENFKNPWLMYEAGVVYGAHFNSPGEGVVIPILFEHIPSWSSWVDKPLNRYVPIRMDNDSNISKDDFKKFITELSTLSGSRIRSFEKNWNLYVLEVSAILERDNLIPNACIDLVNQIMEDNGNNFTLESPEITKAHILFHKGFSTHALTKILLNNVIDFQGKRLWFFGRRNKKIFNGENDDFFLYLASEGLDNGVDFKCLFPHPKSAAMIKAVSKDKERRFKADLQTSLESAIRLKNRFNLPIEKMFRFIPIKDQRPL